MDHSTMTFVGGIIASVGALAVGAGILLAINGVARRLLKEKMERTNQYGVEEFRSVDDAAWTQGKARSFGVLAKAGATIAVIAILGGGVGLIGTIYAWSSQSAEIAARPFHSSQLANHFPREIEGYERGEIQFRDAGARADYRRGASRFTLEIANSRRTRAFSGLTEQDTNDGCVRIKSERRGNLWVIEGYDCQEDESAFAYIDSEKAIVLVEGNAPMETLRSAANSIDRKPLLPLMK